MLDFDAQITVKRRRFASQESGFAVLDAALDDGTPLVLVGPLVHLEDRERAHVLGCWVSDRRFGEQVKVHEARPVPPSDRAAVLAYLQRIRHVGDRRAKRLWEMYGTSSALDEIDREPASAFRAAGLSPSAAEEAASSWEELRGMRRLHMLLAPHGLARLAPRLSEALGAGAARQVIDRPYELTRLFGVGFQTADRIARAAGLRADDPARLGAAVLHVLARAEDQGSTCVGRDALPDAVAQLLGPDADEEAVSDAINGLIRAGDLVTADDVLTEGHWVMRADTAALEAELAERLAELMTSRPGGRLPEHPAKEFAGELTDEQRTAVLSAFAQRLSLVTGGPGTGKTATIRAVGSAAIDASVKVLLVAPTGRAALRMTEATGLAASTVHSALKWVPGEGPEHDPEDPLPCDVLIVDECSMANAELLLTLLRAVGPRTHVVLVGDADQLAPVGAGKPFAELIQSGLATTTRLTHIFRQAAGSMIVQAAHSIRRGLPPSFKAQEGMRRDLFFVARPDPADALAEIVSLVCERLPAHYSVDPVRDIQVFAPVYRGDVAIDAVNAALRAALNPNGKAVLGGRLRIGDKVMLTGRNLHELGLMNGAQLRVLDEVGAAGRGDADGLLVADEVSAHRLSLADAERLSLAYACSVHRGQGIELPVAVIVAHPGAGGHRLRREMLYTAITRAKLATVIVGVPGVLERAARNTDAGQRHTLLAERLAAL